MTLPNRSNRPRRPGFSLTELLVVVGIIAVLVSLLLVALGKVQQKAKMTQTLATMDNVRKACEAFFIDQGRYPGAVAEEVLDAGPSLSGTENMLLDLMGGFRVRTPFDRAIPPISRNYTEFVNWNSNDPDMIQLTFSASQTWGLKIVPRLIGEGPWIDGQQFAPYYTPSDQEMRSADGRQLNEPLTDQEGKEVKLPDIVDGWGQPILYTRQVRKSGPLVGDWDDDPQPQFVMNGMQPYTASSEMGEFGQNQIQGDSRSVLNAPLSSRFYNFGQIVRHPAFGAADDPINTGQARGAFVLISAGADGIFFSREDGPGQPGVPTAEITMPSLVAEYDDVIVFGGG